ncbi:hypothetical protein C0Q70_12731 [Pomacea canaliculata]|uniref:Ig-like domain-containing protein n=1 Tax=Pomacea canaliculata TaxID=400727 RepID=A0A2T7P2C5_POMCA|nr:hypothetical protein C0Q70_12731 [Pomacea canaliculata]
MTVCWQVNNNLHYAGRLSLVKGVSLQINYIRPEDEGWYECDITFISDSANKISANGTWIYLTVHCEYPAVDMLCRSHTLVLHLSEVCPPPPRCLAPLRGFFLCLSHLSCTCL